MKKSWSFAAHVFLCVSFLFLAGCGGKPLPDPAFDVPSLVGKDIKGVEQTLGVPSEYTPPDSIQRPDNIREWDKSWEHDKHTLLVTYDLVTGKVIDFFIGTDDPSGASDDQDRLLALGNLQRGDLRYRVEFVPAMGHPDKYTGVKVVPN
jgi:hypothetical protein